MAAFTIHFRKTRAKKTDPAICGFYHKDGKFTTNRKSVTCPQCYSMLTNGKFSTTIRLDE